MTAEEVLITDVPRETFDEFGGLLANYTVGFVKPEMRQPYNDAFLAGSGTLVQIGEQHGILTAHHVITGLPKIGKLGLVLSWDLHQFTLDATNVAMLPLARGPDDSRGPDLGFVALAAPDVETIAAKKSFLNIESARKKVVETKPDIQDGVWAIVGFLDEETKKEPPQRGYTDVRAFRCFPIFGFVEPCYREGSFDYYEFPFPRGEGSVAPKSFGGMSGGGLWQVPMSKRKDGQFEAEAFLLSGVAFYEVTSDKDEGTIRCHGRRSVYRKLPELLEKATSNKTA